MEDPLQYHIRELSVAREEYNTLFDKFRKSKQLYDERDFLNKQKLLALQSECDLLASKNHELKKVIKSQKVTHFVYERELESHSEEIKKLQEVIFEHERNVQQLQSTNNKQEQTITDKKHEADRLEEQVAHLQQQLLQLRNETIPLAEYQQLVHNQEILELRMMNDMVPAELYASLERATSDLKNSFALTLEETNKQYSLQMEQFRDQIKEQMVTKETYLDMVDKCNHMKDRYNELKQKNNELRDENVDLMAQFNAYKVQMDVERVPKSTLEESFYNLQEAKTEMRVLQEALIRAKHDKAAVDDALSEAEERIANMKHRVYENEREMTSLRRDEEERQSLLSELRRQLDLGEQERKDLNDRIMQLENTKASLLTQLGHAKQKTRKELDQTSSMQDEVKTLRNKLAEAEKSAESLKEEHKSQLLDLRRYLEEQVKLNEEQLVRYQQLSRKYEQQGKQYKELEMALVKEQQTVEEWKHRQEEWKATSQEVKAQHADEMKAPKARIQELEMVVGEYFKQLTAAQKAKEDVASDLIVQQRRNEQLSSENQSLQLTTTELAAKLHMVQAQLEEFSSMVLSTAIDESFELSSNHRESSHYHRMAAGNGFSPHASTQSRSRGFSDLRSSIGSVSSIGAHSSASHVGTGGNPLSPRRTLQSTAIGEDLAKEGLGSHINDEAILS